MSSIRGAFTNWLIGGGEMGERIRSFDWAKTPLGPIESWSPALRMMTRFLLANRYGAARPWRTPSGDSREATAVPTHGGHRPRVLIADDNADMRAYLRSILSSRYDVEMEADGAAAIQAMRTNRPALAILDVMMPRMDGFAVLRELREHPSLKDLPVILLSARAGEEAEAEGLAAGADDYIVKPFSARELLARVQASLTLATLRNEATAALRSSEERLRRVLETDAVGVLFWNREGTLVDANNVFLRMTGYTREEVKSGKLHWRSLTAPEYVRASEAQLENFAITGRVGPYEKEYLRKDGSRNWMLFAGRDLGDGSIVEFAIDIADRKRAEAALHDSERRLTRELADTKRLQNFSSLLIEKGNVEGLYEHIVDTAIAIMGADFGSIQMLDEEHSELRLVAWRNFHPDSAKFWRTVPVGMSEACGAALQHGERIVVPDVRAAAFLQGSKSQKYWALSGIVAVQSTPLTTREGHVIGMISTHWRDVHAPDERELRLLDILAREAADYFERGRADAALRESEQRLQLLLREVNHRAKNMLSLVQAVARQTAAASPKDFLARFAERIQAVAKSQDLLVKAEWKGVELAELVRLQLAHFHDLIGGLN